MSKRSDDGGRPSWYIRRRIIIMTLLFCAFCVLWIMFGGVDSRINETIIISAFALAGTTIGSYVFGAAWTDISIDSKTTRASFDNKIASKVDTDER